MGHAVGQVANFRTHSALGATELQRACNALLPPTIRIVGAEEVGPDFHARWCALAKTYRYRLYRGRVVPPALWRYVLHYPFPLDEAAMAAAAARFVGAHDFASFAASTGSEEDDRERSAVREIFSAQLARDATGEELHFTVRGKSFLRHMVRKMIGTLLDVGRGKLPVGDIDRLITQSRTRERLLRDAIREMEDWMTASKRAVCRFRNSREGVIAVRPFLVWA